MNQEAGSTPEAQNLPGCYRHPDRETGIRCTRCERPICPECMVSASVGFHCPECVREGGGPAPTAARPRTIAGGTVTADPRLFTKILIGINVAVFIAIQAKDSLATDLSLIAAWPPAPFAPTEGVADGQYYRLVTSMFAHQEIWHIGFNMLSLWWLGGPLETVLGRARYLALYLIAGFAGSAVTFLLAAPDTGSLGASGAIFGLFGATAVVARRLRADIRPVLALLAINLFLTFAWAGISKEAHLGGLVAGALVAVGLVYAPRKHRTAVQVGTCAAVFLVSVLLIVIRTTTLT